MSRTRRVPSLAEALFLRVSLLLAVIVTLIGAAAVGTARSQINKVYDSQLITGANVLQALMGDELSEIHRGEGTPHFEVDAVPLLSAEDRRAFHDYAEWRMFRIWENGKLVLGSDTGPAISLAATSPPGFHDLHAASGDWRLYTLPLKDEPIVVQVGEQLNQRNVLIQHIALEMILPLLLVIPASLGLIWLSLNNGLEALRALIGELTRRSLRDLKPFDIAAWPPDLAPLLGSINLLFARMGEAYEQERRFVDHAAHQLRTPLAALKLQAQLIGREQDPAERGVQAQLLQDVVARAAALIEQLLTLARLDADAGAIGVCQLREVLADTIADLAPAAAARQIAFAVEGGSQAVRGDPAVVRLIVANILENAVNHAPAGSEVGVILRDEDHAAELIVRDEGPGVPPIQRQKVFQRFFQGEGVRRAGQGAGLGLAITAEAARVLGASVVLEDRDDGASGLQVRVTLPRAGPNMA